MKTNRASALDADDVPTRRLRPVLAIEGGANRDSGAPEERESTRNESATRRVTNVETHARELDARYSEDALEGHREIDHVTDISLADIELITIEEPSQPAFPLVRKLRVNQVRPSDCRRVPPAFGKLPDERG